jgi:pimeloyl-ACP methyl ester carboxylesterase
MEWTDESRDEWFTEENDEDKRKLVLQVWYPTTQTGEPYPYIDNPDLRIFPISKQLELPPFLIRHITQVKTNSLLNAPIVKNQNFPLIIFSHGLGGMKVQNSIQCELLASHGFVVVAIDHPYDANITIFENNHIADYRSSITYLQAKKGKNVKLSEEDFWAFRLPQLETRKNDILFVMDEIIKYKKNAESIWKNVNPQKIGVFGHSFGGATTLIAAVEDERIDACISLDAWFVPIPDNIIKSGIYKPYLYLGRPEWDEPLNNEKLEEFLTNSNSKVEKVYIPQTSHFDYSDTPFISGRSKLFGISGMINNDSLKSKISDKILQFYILNLRGIDE